MTLEIWEKKIIQLPIIRPGTAKAEIKESVAEALTEAIKSAIKNISLKYDKGVEYYNMPISFDTETTSATDEHGEKIAIMYAWGMCINGYSIIGRTWQQWLATLDLISEILELDEKKKIIIYVHNLAFDFQFFRKWLSWKKVFCVDDRKVARADTGSGIEFKCSYILSGYSLADLGDKALTKYKVTKAVGDLDYNLIRHQQTPLTDKEVYYLARDNLVVCAYIQEQIEIEKGITKIPLTKTSYVRRYCRKETIGNAKKDLPDTTKYRKMISNLTLSEDDYTEFKECFQGGFTHAGALKACKLMENVGSADITSSYPTVELSELFPMSKFKPVEVHTISEFDHYLKNFCMIFEVEFTNLRSKIFYENPLAISKCWKAVHATINNGRIVSAEELGTTITEVDFDILTWYYEWDDIAVGNCRIAYKAYLPKQLVTSILDFYQAKTVLKGVEGSEVDYILKKGMLNSNFGMMVTDIVRDKIIYSPAHIWGIEHADKEQQIRKYNADRSRFLFYPWGVYITAYARRNLFSAIYEFGGDYVYSDTDSVKGVNFKAHEKYFKNYNNLIVEKLEECMAFHEIDPERLRPANIKGKQEQLGIWDYEGEYRFFKTLGAKRYMTYKDDQLNITVAGLNKQYAVPYICKLAKIPYTVDKNGNTHTPPETVAKAFELFDDELYIPGEYTGKKTHTYIDIERKGIITDYTGKAGKYYEKSGVHLENAEYSLSLSNTYIDYLRGIKNIIV